MNYDAQSFADNLGHKLRKLSDREMGMMQAKILQCYNDSLSPPISTSHVHDSANCVSAILHRLAGTWLLLNCKNINVYNSFKYIYIIVAIGEMKIHPTWRM